MGLRQSVRRPELRLRSTKKPYFSAIPAGLYLRASSKRLPTIRTVLERRYRRLGAIGLSTGACFAADLVRRQRTARNFPRGANSSRTGAQTNYLLVPGRNT